MTRRAAKLDSNHAAIVKTFQACGVRVLSLAGVAFGCPDLLINVRGQLRLVEIKDGSKAPSERRLTPDQHAFHALWPVWVIETEEQAIALAGGRITA